MQIINPSELIGIVLFLLIVWAVVMTNPKVDHESNKKILYQNIARLKVDFKTAMDLEQLERLYKMIDKIFSEAKKVVSNADEIATDLLAEYNNRHFDLINTEFPGIPQQYLKFLTLK